MTPHPFTELPGSRSVSFVTDAFGQVLKRDEADNRPNGDPHEVHYYFNGLMIGDVSNNGTSDVDYAASIAAPLTALSRRFCSASVATRIAPLVGLKRKTVLAMPLVNASGAPSGVATPVKPLTT